MRKRVKENHVAWGPTCRTAALYLYSVVRKGWPRVARAELEISKNGRFAVYGKFELLATQSREI